MNVLVRLFQRYGPAAKVAKSHTMTFQPIALRPVMSEEAKGLKCIGVGDSYQVRLRQRIPFLECRVELTAWSMAVHHQRMHGTEPAVDWIQLPVS